MLLKYDKLPSLSTNYGPISLMSSIMKLFERVSEQMLRCCLEDIGLMNKYQSGFRQAKSLDDHLFRLSQSVTRLTSKKRSTTFGTMELRYKIFMLDLPTKMARWLSDFLVGRVIQAVLSITFPDIRQ